LFACGPFTIEVLQEVPGGDATQARYVPLPPERLHGRGPGPALTFLKLLVSQPDRYAPKDWLIEHLRTDEYTITPKRLENIVSFVRQLLSLPDGTKPAGMLRYVRASHESGDGYRLAPYPLIWLDVDALAHTVRQACLLERFGDDALPFWERAYQLASRGVYLSEEPYSEWAEARREEVEGHLRQCVHALVRLWLARHGEAAEEEVLHLLRGYWPRHPDDEDVAWALMDLLGRRGRYQEALDVYAVLEQSLEEQGLTKEGKPRVPDQRTRDLAEYLRFKDRQSLISPPPHREAAPLSPAGALVQYDRTAGIPVLSMTAIGQDEMLALFSQAVKQGILQAASELEGDMMDQLRRKFLQQTFSILGTVVLPPHALFHAESWEQLSRALNNHQSSRLDDGALDELEALVGSYWRLFYNGASSDLLSGVLALLQTIKSLLTSSYPTTLEQHLYALTSQTSLLAGKIALDHHQYPAVDGYYSTALQAAGQAADPILHAVVLSRIASVLIEKKQPERAIPFFQEARRLCSPDTSAVTAVWLALHEAEAWAMMNQETPCLKALEGAEQHRSKILPEDDPYWTGLDPALLFGFQGVCYLKLHRPGEAQQALHTALSVVPPSSRRQTAIFFCDLALAFAQGEEIEAACTAAEEALRLVACTQSTRVMHRLQEVHHHLGRWSQEACVRHLTEQLVALQHCIK
jgi:tetratricopeptide (TPR) repeat protein